MSSTLLDSAVKPAVAQTSSFRDPKTQVYFIDDIIYRQINPSGYADYKHLIDSGLYEVLQYSSLLITHREVRLHLAFDEKAKVVIQPEKLRFTSYCYEWCFSQYKDAALLTLRIMKLALKYNMILKDASAYNVQFHRGKPVFIDTGSFEIYQEGMPWTAYGQFCRHFLAPLLLMAKIDIRLSSLMKQYIDGIPLDIVSRMLPRSTWCSFSIVAHIHAHAKAQKKYHDAGYSTVKSKPKLSKLQLLGMLDNLSTLISKLQLPMKKTEWGDYYNQTNYSDKATLYKAEAVRTLITKANTKYVWDLGSNNGYYSRIASEFGANVVCFDIDPVAVETNYQREKKEQSERILPLILDLTNPSHSLGWGQDERCGLKERGPADLIMALALIHHLTISNNIPLEKIAKYFKSLGAYLIIEFVPKEDSQVQRLLLSRQDIFPDYHLESFKKIFSTHYVILEEMPLIDTHRTLFLMKRKS